MKLRGDQISVIDQTRQGFIDGHRCQLITMPTGAGKTVIAGEITRLAKERGRHVLFVVHLVELVQQTVEKFERHGLKCSVLQADNTLLLDDADCTVATIHTLRARLKRNPALVDAALVVFDEAHIVFAAHTKLMESWNAVPFIGMSATPIRPGLGQMYTSLIRGLTIGQMIEQGLLVKPVCYGPSEPDLSKLNIRKTQFGDDFAQNELCKRMRTIVGDVVSSWRRLSQCRKTIVFAVDVAHALALSEQFNAEGIRALTIHYKSSPEDRDAALAGFRDGSIPILISVNVLAIGFDEPDVGCVVLARPTLSQALYIQQLGRGLRTCENKRNVIVIDCAGNIARHGLVEGFEVPDLDSDELETPSRAKIREKQAYPCSSCGYMLEPSQGECPICFHRNERQNDVEHLAGSLVELESGDTVVEPISPKQFYRELLWKVHTDLDRWSLKRARGAYKGRYDEWPSREWDTLAPVETSAETNNYLKAEYIRYCKSKERDSAQPIADALPHWVPPAGMTPSKQACTHINVGLFKSNKPTHLAMRKCLSCGVHIKWVGAAELLKEAKTGDQMVTNPRFQKDIKSYLNCI